MKTKVIAFTTAAAIALTGMTAAPAQASPEDNLLKFLVGAVIVGAIVNEANKNNTVVVKRNKAHRHTTRVVTRGKPNVCKRSRYGKHGLKVWYRKSCMVKHGWQRNSRGVWYTYR